MKKLLKSLLFVLPFVTIAGCSNPFASTSTSSGINAPVTSFNGVSSVINYDINNTYTKIYSENQESVGLISAQYVYNNQQLSYSTSGFIYSKDNSNSNKYYFVTNASGLFHYTFTRNFGSGQYNLVCYTDGDFEVLLGNSKRYTANLIGYYEGMDVSVFSIETSDDLKPLTIGDFDKMDVGDEILAIGTPILDSTLLNSFNKGVVSGENRQQIVTMSYGMSNYEIAEVPTFQFDAPVNGGMEGGPVFNDEGEVIGMISYKYYDATDDIGTESMSMATAINDIVTPINSIISNGEYVKPVLGVSIVNVYDIGIEEKGNYFIDDYTYSVHEDVNEGLLILEISENSASESSGMVVNEVIVAFDNMPVKNISQLTSYLNRHVKGDKVVIQTKTSDGSTKSYDIKL